MVTLSFVLSSIFILLTPGPTNTVLATCGASLGLRKAALMPLAEALGYVLALRSNGCFEAAGQPAARPCLSMPFGRFPSKIHLVEQS